MNTWNEIIKWVRKDDLKAISYVVVALWILSQLYIISLYWDKPLYSDAGRYQELAYYCFYHGKWYPMSQMVANDNIIFNPGYVNFLILQLKLIGTLKFYSIINFALNILFLTTIKSIISYIISPKGGRLAVLFFCLLPSNHFSVVITATELFVASLIFAAICVVRKNYLLLLFSSILFVYAEYTRPCAILFIPSLIIYMVFKKYGVKYIMTFVSSFALFYVILSLAVVNCTDAQQLKGATGGVNLIMGANDDMSGRYEPIVFSEGKSGFIYNSERYDVYQKDSILTSRALSWVKEHPIKYLAYAPLKALYLYFQDVYWNSFFENHADNNNLKLFKSQIPISKAIVIVLRNLGYYILIIITIIGLFKAWKSEREQKIYLGIYMLPLLLNTLMIMAIVGAPRYHYITNPILILYAVLGILGVNEMKKSNIIKAVG